MTTTQLGMSFSWDFGDGMCDAVSLERSVFRAELKKLGFDPDKLDLDAVDTIDVEEALHRAARKGWAQKVGLGDRRSIEKLRQHENDTKVSYGVFMAADGDKKEDDRKRVGARLRIDKTTGEISVEPPVDRSIDEACEKVARACQEYAAKLQTHVFNEEIGNCIRVIGTKLGWVGRRKNLGGVYFMPHGKECDAFTKLMDRLVELTKDKSGTQQFFGDATEVLMTDRQSRLWTRRTKEDFEENIDQLLADLKKFSASDNTRESTWNERQARCHALMQRADRYASLLGEKLSNIKEVISTLEKDFGNARDAATTAAKKTRNAFGTIRAMAEKAKQESAKQSPPEPAKELAKPPKRRQVKHGVADLRAAFARARGN